MKGEKQERKGKKNVDGEKDGRTGFELDVDLLRSIESVFEDTQDVVLAVFEVLRVKASEDNAGSALLKALGAKSHVPVISTGPEPRVLVLTVRRSRGRAGGPDTGGTWRPYLHICKPDDGGDEDEEADYEVSHSLGLKVVQEVKVCEEPYQRAHLELPLLDLVLNKALLDSESPLRQHPLPQFAFKDVSHMHAFLSLILRIDRLTGPGARPTPLILTGKDSKEWQTWWMQHGRSLVSSMTDFAAQVLAEAGPDVLGGSDAPDTGAGAAAGGAAAASGATGGASKILVSAKEERDLEQLLEVYAVGLSDVAEFEARLNQEHEALQAANIASLLSNGPMVDNVVLQLKKTARLLEDLDETLQVFDIKMRTMREDIAVIEDYNNSLQRTERNNARLLDALQTLLSDLRVSPDMRQALAAPAFDTDRLSNVMKPGWSLVRKLSRFSPGAANCINSSLLQMSVVQEAKREMQDLAQVYANKAVAHLTAKLNKAVDGLASEISKLQDKSAKTSRPDHQVLINLRSKHSELIALIQSLSKTSLATWREAYVKAINMLLRKEVHAAVTELRKAVALDSQYNSMDFNLVKEVPASKRAGASVPGGSSDVASLMSDMDGVGVPGSGAVRPGGARTAVSTASALSRSTYGTAASLHMVTKARPGPPEASLAMPVNEAWSLLLQEWLPLLLQELQEAAAVMFPDDTSGQAKDTDAAKTSAEAGSSGKALPDPSLRPEVQSTLRQLLDGLEAEFMSLATCCSKSSHHHQVLSLPMMASTTYWLQQILTSPVALPLAALLAACHDKLKLQLAEYKQTQFTGIEAYAAKAAAGVKSMHVLPFTSQFSLLLHHQVQITAGQQDVAALAKSQQLEAAKQKALVLPVWLSSTEWLDPSSTASFTTQRQLLSISSAMTWRVRSSVDELLQALVAAMTNSIDKMAEMDPKHGQRLRLENYAYFTESTRPLLVLVKALEQYHQRAEDKLEEALQQYVLQQLQDSVLWPLLDWSNKVEKLLQVVQPHEVSFQSGFTASDAKSLINSCMKEPAKTLSAMVGRIRKHLGTSGLALRVWDKTQSDIMTRYKALSQQLSHIYPSPDTRPQLRPSSQELRDVLAQVGLPA